MKYKLLIDPLAKQYLKDIYFYILMNNSKSSANKLLDSLKKTCYKLKEFPERGHIPIELRST